MHIQLIPTLALAIGMLALIMPATLQTPVRVSFPQDGRDQSEKFKVNNLPIGGNANRVGGMYGFRYRGF